MPSRKLIPETNESQLEAIKKYKEKIEPYYTALGEFISRFSEIELAMQLLLWEVSGLSQNVAKTIFAGYKIDQSIGAIRKFYKGRNAEIPKALDNMLAQCAAINEMRNLVIHYKPEFYKDTITVSNKAVKPKGAEVKKRPVSIKMLKDMVHDLIAIYIVVRATIDKRKRKVTDTFYKKITDGAEHHSFSYKSPQLEKKDRKRPSNSHKR